MEHFETTVEYYGKHQKANGFVAWCNCGIGSPLKQTKSEARASLQRHIDNPDKVRPK